MRSFAITLVTVFLGAMLLAPGTSHSAEKFGLLFSIEGKARLIDPAGKSFTLTRAKDILRPVMEGDTIEVAQGRIVLVSLRSNEGYEFPPDSAGQVRAGRLVTVKGRIGTKSGLTAPKPDEKPRGTLAGVVVRRAAHRCIFVRSPAGAAIIDLTPTLGWLSHCKETKKVTIEISAGKKVIYTAQTDTNSLKVPGSILQYGKTYRWAVKSSGLEEDSATFSILKQREAEDIRARIASSMLNRADTAERLSLIFYLNEKGLIEQAGDEMRMLKEDFPGNEYVSDIGK